jgi:hypothetical protein
MTRQLFRSTTGQSGAALATALFFLVILTLLGLAAMRAGTLDLRLSQNEVGRFDAQQNAQTALDAVNQYSAALNVQTGSGYLQSCVLGASLDATAIASSQGFSCPSAQSVPALLPDTLYKGYLYASVYRESYSGADYAPVSAIREGDSGGNFQLASFTITAGYDRIATTGVASGDETAQGGAEIAQGKYVKVARIKGLTQQ